MEAIFERQDAMKTLHNVNRLTRAVARIDKYTYIELTNISQTTEYQLEYVKNGFVVREGKYAELNCWAVSGDIIAVLDKCGVKHNLVLVSEAYRSSHGLGVFLEREQAGEFLTLGGFHERRA